MACIWNVWACHTYQFNCIIHAVILFSVLTHPPEINSWLCYSCDWLLFFWWHYLATAPQYISIDGKTQRFTFSPVDILEMHLIFVKYLIIHQHLLMLLRFAFNLTCEKWKLTGQYTVVCVGTWPNVVCESM